MTTTLQPGRRIKQGLALGLMLAVIPAGAYAVGVSSNDGSGTQNATSTYGNGKAVNGNLRSTSGANVYYQGQVNWGLCSDDTIGRYAANVNTSTYQVRGGNITSLAFGCTLQGVRSKICKVNTGLPDGCGPWSARY